MDTRDAFDAIQNKMKADPRKRMVQSSFDEQVFGNFCITYDEGSERLSVVNDRGQLILYGGPAADEFKSMLVDDLRSASEEAVLRAVS